MHVHFPHALWRSYFGCLSPQHWTYPASSPPPYLQLRAVLVLYMLFRGGAVVILKWFLYFMLLTPFIIPVFRYSLRWLMVPGKCPSCGIGFRAMRGAKPPVRERREGGCCW